MKQNLKARIITGAILLSALAFAIIMGGWVFSVICATISLSISASSLLRRAAMASRISSAAPAVTTTAITMEKISMARLFFSFTSSAASTTAATI